MSSYLRKAQERREVLAKVEEKRKALARRDKLEDLPHDIILDELDLQRGNILETAKSLDVGYAQLSAYIDKKPDLTQLLMLGRTKLIDKAESVLLHHLERKSLRATFFVLKTLGKSRGYIEPHHTPVPESEDLNKAKMKVDLTKLSTDQLTQLQGILADANRPSDSDIIDITPDPATSGE